LFEFVGAQEFSLPLYPLREITLVVDGLGC
jgi:hypothetical protein